MHTPTTTHPAHRRIAANNQLTELRRQLAGPPTVELTVTHAERGSLPHAAAANQAVRLLLAAGCYDTSADKGMAVDDELHALLTEALLRAPSLAAHLEGSAR